MAFLTYKNKQGQWEYFEAPNTVKTVEQALTLAQQAQARENIGLALMIRTRTEWAEWLNADNSFYYGQRIIIDNGDNTLTEKISLADDIKTLDDLVELSTDLSEIEQRLFNLEQTKLTGYISETTPPNNAPVGSLWICTETNIKYGEEVRF